MKQNLGVHCSKGIRCVVARLWCLSRCGWGHAHNASVVRQPPRLLSGSQKKYTSSCIVWIVVAVHNEVVTLKPHSAEARVSSWVQATHGTSRPIDLPHFHVLMHVAAFVVLVNSQVSSDGSLSCVSTTETSMLFMENSLGKEFFTFLAHSR